MWVGITQQSLTLKKRDSALPLDEIAIINQPWAEPGGPAFHPEDLRRDIVTSKTDLNAFKDQHVRIGQVELFGVGLFGVELFSVEIYEPGTPLAKKLANNHLSRTQPKLAGDSLTESACAAI